MVRSEEFIAKRNDGCARCDVRALCARSSPKAGRSSDERQLRRRLSCATCWGSRSAISSWRPSLLPSAPGVIVAGAGSGKTTAMAARVVWLICTGQVQPEEVLGPDLHQEGGQRARRPDPRRPDQGRRTRLDAAAGPAPDPRRAPAQQHPELGARGTGRARRLDVPRVRGHVDRRARAAARPRAGRPGARRRHPVPARGSRSYGDQPGRSGSPRTTCRRWSTACSRSTASWRTTCCGRTTYARMTTRCGPEVAAARQADSRGAQARRDRAEAWRDPAAGRGVPGIQGRARRRRLRRPDGARRAAGRGVPGGRGRSSGRGTRSCCSTSTRTPSVSQRRMLTALFAGRRTRASGHRGRRPVPGDLRLARRLRREPGRVPEHFPQADGSPARRYVLSVNRRCGSTHPRRGQPARGRALRAAPRRHPARSPAPTRREGAITVGLFETRSQEIEWVADAIVAAHRTPNRRWKDIGILMRTNVDLSAVHEALIAAQGAGRGGRPRRICSRCPRSSTSSRRCRP